MEYLDIFCCDDGLNHEYTYGRIWKNSINTQLYNTLGTISNSANKCGPRIYNKEDPENYDYHHCEMDILNYLINKYSLIDKIEWFTNEWKPGHLYLLVKTNYNVDESVPAHISIWIKKWCTSFDL